MAWEILALRQDIWGSLDQAMTIFATDLDGDLDVDVMACTDNAKEVIWLENLDGQGNFGDKQVIDQSLQDPVSVTAADMDGDGDPDAIASFL